MLDRHKVFMDNLNAQRHALVRLAEEQAKRREAKKAIVASQQQAFRDLVRHQAPSSPRAGDGGGFAAPRSPRPDSSAPVAAPAVSRSYGDGLASIARALEAGQGPTPPPSRPSTPPPATAATSKAKKAHGKPKPAWATSAAAVEAADAEEAARLVNFAKDLDYDR